MTSCNYYTYDKYCFCIEYLNAPSVLNIHAYECETKNFYQRTLNESDLSQITQFFTLNDFNNIFEYVFGKKGEQYEISVIANKFNEINGTNEIGETDKIGEIDKIGETSEINETVDVINLLIRGDICVKKFNISIRLNNSQITFRENFNKITAGFKEEILRSVEPHEVPRFEELHSEIHEVPNLVEGDDKIISTIHTRLNEIANKYHSILLSEILRSFQDHKKETGLITHYLENRISKISSKPPVTPTRPTRPTPLRVDLSDTEEKSGSHESMYTDSETSSIGDGRPARESRDDISSTTTSDESDDNAPTKNRRKHLQKMTNNKKSTIDKYSVKNSKKKSTKSTKKIKKSEKTKKTVKSNSNSNSNSKHMLPNVSNNKLSVSNNKLSVSNNKSKVNTNDDILDIEDNELGDIDNSGSDISDETAYCLDRDGDDSSKKIKTVSTPSNQVHKIPNMPNKPFKPFNSLVPFDPCSLFGTTCHTDSTNSQKNSKKIQKGSLGLKRTIILDSDRDTDNDNDDDSDNYNGTDNDTDNDTDNEKNAKKLDSDDEKMIPVKKIKTRDYDNCDHGNCNDSEDDGADDGEDDGADDGEDDDEDDGADDDEDDNKNNSLLEEIRRAMRLEISFDSRSNKSNVYSNKSNVYSNKSNVYQQFMGRAMKVLRPTHTGDSMRELMLAASKLWPIYKKKYLNN